MRPQRTLDGTLAEYRGRRVLVTGAAGFVGRWVSRLLDAAGADLLLLARDPGALARVCAAYGIRGRPVAADLAAPGSFARIWQDERPEIAFNLAGYGIDPAERDEALMRRINSELVGEMAETIAEASPADWAGQRLVHAGSAFEYGILAGPITEESPPRPNTAYGRVKLAGTELLRDVVRRSGLRAVAARLCTLYGPGEHPGRLLPSLLEAARSGRQLELTSGRQERDFTYVGDVAEGLLRLGALADRGPGVVNLATGTLCSVRRFAESAGEVLAMKPDQLRFGALAHRENEVWQGPVDVGLLERLAGWRPRTTIREGILATRDFLAAREERRA